jgi:hypothetical protein
MSNIRQAIHGLAFEEDERGGLRWGRSDETYIYTRYTLTAPYTPDLRYTEYGITHTHAHAHTTMVPLLPLLPCPHGSLFVVDDYNLQPISLSARPREILIPTKGVTRNGQSPSTSESADSAGTERVHTIHKTFFALQIIKSFKHMFENVRPNLLQAVILFHLRVRLLHRVLVHASGNQEGKRVLPLAL